MHVCIGRYFAAFRGESMDQRRNWPNWSDEAWYHEGIRQDVPSLKYDVVKSRLIQLNAALGIYSEVRSCQQWVIEKFKLKYTDRRTILEYPKAWWRFNNQKEWDSNEEWNGIQEEKYMPGWSEVYLESKADIK